MNIKIQSSRSLSMTENISIDVNNIIYLMNCTYNGILHFILMLESKHTTYYAVINSW